MFAVEAVQTLIELGANVNAANQITGGTPLHCVAQSSKAKSAERRLQVVDLLLQAGANPSAVDLRGRTPVEYCSCDAYGDDALRERLEPQVPVIFQILQNKESSCVAALRRLLEDDEGSDAAVDVRHHGLTPLLTLMEDLQKYLEDVDEDMNIQQQKKESSPDWEGILQTLLKHKADPNALPLVPTEPTATTSANVQDSEDLALHKICVALKEAHRCKNADQIQLLEPMAKLLIQHGALIPTPTQQLLHDASRRNQLGFVKFLLDVVQVDINCKGRQGMTALHFASRSGQVEMVQYLLSVSNINVVLPDDRGKTALDAARANDHSKVAALLESYIQNSPATATNS